MAEGRSLIFTADPGETAELVTQLSAHVADAHACEQLAAYGAALLAANRLINVSGAKSVEALVPHLLEALDLVPYITGPFVDIGSGGGLPALPVALVTRQPATLIEAVGKKAAVLRELLLQTAAPGAIRAQRAEDAARDPLLRERFTIATARAVSGPTTVAEYVLPFVAVGGRALMPRAPLTQQERDGLLDACRMLGAVLEAELPAPHGHGLLVVLRKTHPIALRFPRRNGIPAKRPLCMPDVSRETGIEDDAALAGARR